MWHAFQAADPTITGHYDVVSFGDSPELADELAELVVAGTKRATAGALRSFVDEPVPKVGDHVVLIDGHGRARCVWRTTDVEIKPLIEVDDQFAWDEGEGDRSRAYWLDAHRRYFRREAERAGHDFDDLLITVFERFTVVWPPDLADS